jgi:hypothetical protein
MTDPRLAITLLVRDEADIIAATLEFYLAQSPVAIIVTDNGSVDGTSEILQAYAGAGHIVVIHEPELDYRQSEWVTRMARMAVTRFDAQWVVNLDADEFWVSRHRDRSLANELGRVPDRYDMVRARRDDLRYTGNRPEQGPWSERLIWRDRRTVATNGKPLGRKVAHRGAPNVVVAQGNHDVSGLPSHSVFPEEPIEILHLPLRSWAQYSQKIANGGSAYEANRDLGPEVGWHWRQEYRLLVDGKLRGEFDARLLTRTDTLRGILTGRLKRDVWLAHHLRALVPHAAMPELLAASLSR